MLRVSLARLGGHGPASIGNRFTARVFNTTPQRIAALSGDVTALGPLIAVCAGGATVCVGYMARTLLTHPDVYLGAPGGDRTKVIRDNQHDASDHHGHLVRRMVSRDASQVGSEFDMQIFAGLNKAAGDYPRHNEELVYPRAVAEKKKEDALAASVYDSTKAELLAARAAETAAAIAAAAAATAAAAAAAAPAKAKTSKAKAAAPKAAKKAKKTKKAKAAVAAE